jgi:hypothetical protein
MKIKKVYDDFKYSPEMLDKIKDNWEDRTVYYVVSPREKFPENEPYYNTIEDAMKALNLLNFEWNEQSYCIIETKFRVLPDTEINLLLNSKKFNI